MLMELRKELRECKRRPIAGGMVALAFFALLCLPGQQAWASCFGGAYITDVNGNAITSSSPIDFDLLSQGIVFHLGPNAQSTDIYRNESGLPPALTSGIYDLQTGGVIVTTVEQHVSYETDGDGASGYYIFRPTTALQPGRQYEFVFRLMRPVNGTWSPSNGYFESFTATFATPAGEEGVGDGGDAPDGALAEGDGLEGGMGSGDSADTSPDAGDLGGSFMADPEMGAGAPQPETGASSDATVNANDWSGAGLGARAAEGTQQPDAEGSPAQAATASGLEAESDRLDAAPGANANTPDASRGEQDLAQTGRTVTGAQLASMGTVRTLAGASDATDQQDVQPDAMSMLAITGYPLLWLVLMAAIVLALPAGALARAASAALGRHLPTRLAA